MPGRTAEVGAPQFRTVQPENGRVPTRRRGQQHKIDPMMRAQGLEEFDLVPVEGSGRQHRDVVGEARHRLLAQPIEHGRRVRQRIGSDLGHQSAPEVGLPRVCLLYTSRCV